jgi:hypothetical protein
LLTRKRLYQHGLPFAGKGLFAADQESRALPGFFLWAVTRLRDRPTRPVTHQIQAFVRRQRGAEQIALGLVATVGAQIRQLRLGFDAFRHHGQAEAAAQRDDGANDGGIVVVARNVIDERADRFSDSEWKKSSGS